MNSIPDVAAMVETAPRTAIRRHFEAAEQRMVRRLPSPSGMDRGLYPYEGDSVSADDAKRRAAFNGLRGRRPWRESGSPSLQAGSPGHPAASSSALLRDTVETPAL